PLSLHDALPIFGTIAGELAMTAGMLAFLAPPEEWRRRIARRALRLAVPLVVLGAALTAADTRLPVIATTIVGLSAYAAAAALTGAVSRDHHLILLRAVPGGLRSRRAWTPVVPAASSTSARSRGLRAPGAPCCRCCRHSQAMASLRAWWLSRNEALRSGSSAMPRGDLAFRSRRWES